MKLAKLQEKFITAIYDESNIDVFSEIKSRGITKDELVSIYRNNLAHNLVNSLKLTYENVFRVLKESKFVDIARKFIINNPSKSNNLDDYGENFDEFLRSQEGDYICDIAKLDWLRQKSYLSKNDADFDLETLKQVAPEELFDLKFSLSNSAFTFESNYNLTANRRQNSEMKRKSYFLVHRTKKSGVFEVESLRIEPQQYNFLRGVIDELTLYEIYEKYEVDIQNILQKFLSNGIIVSFK